MAQVAKPRARRGQGSVECHGEGGVGVGGGGCVSGHASAIGLGQGCGAGQGRTVGHRCLLRSVRGQEGRDAVDLGLGVVDVHGEADAAGADRGNDAGGLQPFCGIGRTRQHRDDG